MDPNTNDIDQQLTNLAGLADPLRRALYRHVTERGEPVSRDDAALADLLASAVAADPSGTTQAALHHAAATLGTDLATQAATPPTPKGDPAQVPATLRQVPATLRQVLASRGYEPSNDTDGTIRLRNCPFDRITTHHRQLVCGPNHAILQALTDHPPHPRHPRPTTPTLLRRPDPRRLRVTSQVTISGWIPNSRLQARVLQGVHRTAAGQVVGRSSLSACREP